MNPILYIWGLEEQNGPGLVTLTIHSLYTCYLIVQPVPPAGITEVVPCVIISM